jgi:hypothetical protein
MSVGASPDFATAKVTPSGPYVGLPVALNELTAPLVKSTLIAFPNAVSGAHATLWSACIRSWIGMPLTCKSWIA